MKHDPCQGFLEHAQERKSLETLDFMGKDSCRGFLLATRDGKNYPRSAAWVSNTRTAFSKKHCPKLRVHIILVNNEEDFS
jgi:hypothetical protein